MHCNWNKNVRCWLNFWGSFVLRMLLAFRTLIREWIKGIIHQKSWTIRVEFGGVGSNVTGSSNPRSLEFPNSGLSVEMSTCNLFIFFCKIEDSAVLSGQGSNRVFASLLQASGQGYTVLQVALKQASCHVTLIKNTKQTLLTLTRGKYPIDSSQRRQHISKFSGAKNSRQWFTQMWLKVMQSVLYWHIITNKIALVPRWHCTVSY